MFLIFFLGHNIFKHNLKNCLLYAKKITKKLLLTFTFFNEHSEVYSLFVSSVMIFLNII
jgi:hypothetical protein